MAAERGGADLARRPIVALERRIGDLFGLSLKECTPEGLAQRLRFRIQDRALDGVEAYAEYLLYSEDPAAWEALAETLTANESRVFGMPSDFAPLFEITSDPQWSRYANPEAGPFRCLSAACGTGEEAYSLAIALAEARAPALEFEVIGVDLSARAIASARRASYPRARAASLPAEILQRYFTERDGEIVAEPLRTRVRFARINLCEPDSLAPLESFDLILARDFLPALTADGRRAALTNLSRALKPGGVLVLGPGDSVGESDLGLTPTRWGERYAYEKPDAEAGAVRGAAPEEDPDPRMALVAHHSSLVRAWVRILLEQRGFAVDEAPDGIRVLERAVIGRPPGVYLLERTLPPQGGPWVADRLARLGAPRPVVLAFLAPGGGSGSEGAPPNEGAQVIELPLSGRDLDAVLPRHLP